MIEGLDHVAIAVRDFDAAVDGYRRLLGREPDLAPRDGAKRAWDYEGFQALPTDQVEADIDEDRIQWSDPCRIWWAMPVS